MAVFVGRSKELTWLERRLDDACAGRGRVVFITAEPGAGKSTLVSQFLVNAAIRAPETRLIGAACAEQFGGGEPYQPFVEAFRDLTSGGPGPTSRWQDLRDIASQIAPAWIAAIPVAGGIISATMSTAAEVRKLGGAATAAPSEEALFFQYAELFLAAARQSPIVLFIDDLHWADRASVALLTHLARKVANERVLIIGTFRPADVDVTHHPIREAKLELERYRIAEELPLPALAETELGDLIREELDAPPTPEMLQWMTRNAGSNPLFFSELLQWLIEQRHAELRHGEWTLVRVPEAIEVPRSAESAIERRLSRLDPEVYRIIEYASVEGTEFGSTALAALLGMDELALEEAMEPVVRLHRLARLEDTRELPSGDLSSIYQFTHSLIRDVLHRGLQGKRRILLHRKMAEILERLYGADLDQVVHRLAFHFDEGRVPGAAFDFAMRGAARASSVYAHHDATELIRLALRNAREPAQRVAALEHLGDESRVIGRYPEALAALTEALDLVEEEAALGRRITLERKLVQVERDHGGSSPAVIEAQLQLLAARARATDAPAELCQILWLLNGLPGELGDEAIARAREALRTAESMGVPDLVAQAQFNLGRTLAFGPDPEAGIPHLRESIALYGTMDASGRLGRCHNALAIVFMLRGEYAESSREYAAAASYFEKAGDPVNRASVSNNLGILLTRMGRWEEAEASLLGCLRITERLDAAARSLHPLENLGLLYQARGDWDAARSHWERVLERARGTGYWSFEAKAHCGIGLALLEEGDITGALEHERAAAALLDGREGWSDEHTELHLLSANIAAAAGDDARALDILRSADAPLALRDRYFWATFRLRAAEILAARDPGAARGAVAELLSVFERQGADPMRRRAEQLLATLGGTA